MIKNFPIGQYVPGDSVVHRLDPRTKIIIALLMVVLLFLASDFAAFLLLGTFTLGAVLLSRIPPRMLWKALKPILFIIGLTMVFHLFMTEGEVVGRLGPLKVTREGIQNGLFLTTRLIMLIVSTSLLTLTTSPISLTDGLEHLMNPFRRIGVPAHELAMMITIALRFIPTLLGEADKIIKAQMARGADFETGNIVRRARSLIPLLVPLFIGAFRRADELAMAMEARAYRGGEGRTRFRQLAVARLDYGAMALTTLVTFGLLWLRFA